MTFTWSWDEIRRLSVPERLQLVEDIWDSIAQDAGAAPALTETQRLELERRWASHVKDPSKAQSWSDVKDELGRRR